MAYLLVKPDYIKDRTVIDENVDDKYLNVAILEAQEIHIREILGTALYDAMISGSQAGTLTANYTTLLNDYIKPALTYRALFEVSPFLLYKIRNKSIGTKNADNFNPDTEGMERLVDNFESKAQFYEQRCIRYLIENHELFTEYDNPGTGYDTIHPRQDTYDSGIWTGEMRKLPNGLDIDLGRDYYC